MELVDRAEFDREVQRLYDAAVRSFSENPLERSKIKANIINRLSGGTPYLESVYIEKNNDREYEGVVTIDEDRGVRVRFRYESTVPFDSLDGYIDQSGAQTINAKGELAEQMIGITVMNDSGEEIKGNVRDSVIEYLKGSVPYAILHLEHQIRTDGIRQGTFKIPRAEDLE